MSMSVMASGDVSSLAWQQGIRSAARQERVTWVAPADGENRMTRDLASVLNELGMSDSGSGQSGNVAFYSINDSLEAFINIMMDAMKTQLPAPPERGSNVMKRDLQKLASTLDTPETGSKADLLQAQLDKLLKSSGLSRDQVSLKEVLSGVAARIPDDAASRKGYRVDTRV